jgi:hypothetical protein
VAIILARKYVWNSPSCPSNHYWTVPAAWMGATSSWKTAFLFGNNVWIIGCTWLRNVSKCCLPVIWTWMVIMDPIECCFTILLPKPSQNLPHISHCWNGAFRIVGHLGCSRNVKSSWYNSVKDDSSDYTTHAFPVVWCPGIMVVTPSFTHLNITCSNQRFNNCSPTVDVGFVKLTLRRTVFMETGFSRWIFISAVTCVQ